MNSISKTLLLGSITLALVGCKNNSENKDSAKEQNMEEKDTAFVQVNLDDFESTIDGKGAKLFTLENKNGLKAYFTNYGGRLVSLLVPDKNGELTDVVLGFDSAKDFKEATEPYFGATIGRYGNRIAKGKFTLKGEEYNIPINNGENSLHGGEKGFQDVVWDAEQPDENTVIFSYLSEDMEEGFPGNLEVKVTYSLNQDNELEMEYEAETDKTTVVNLTNHAFFNLNGEGSGKILGHSLQIYADKFTPVDEGLIPTGELKEVEGTVFDFTEAKTIGKDIDTENEQLTYGKGYDHNYALSGKKEMGMNHAATVKGDKSGIVMNVYTEEPGLQFYSGNFMESKNTLKSGTKDDFRTAFALETQHFPDSPNQSDFPSTVLEPGDIYKTKSIYAFDVVE